DVSFVALPVLAIAAGCIGNSRCVQLKEDWTEPSLLWCVTVGKSGSGKSPALRAARSALTVLVRELFAEYAKELKLYEGGKLKYEEEKGKARKEKKGRPARQEAPVKKRVLVSDITVEKLIEYLEDTPHGLMLMREEISAWFGSFARSRGKAAVESGDLPY